MILVLKLIAGTIFPLICKTFFNFTAEGEIFYRARSNFFPGHETLRRTLALPNDFQLAVVI